MRGGKLAYIKDVTLPSESDTSEQGGQRTVPVGAISFSIKAAREGGQILILPSLTEEVGGLSDLTGNLSEGKDNKNANKFQGKGERLTLCNTKCQGTALPPLYKKSPKDSLKWVEKEEVSNGINSVSLYGGRSDISPRLISTANIILSFDNPTVSTKINTLQY